MNKMTVTIKGIDKKTMRYIVEKVNPIPGGLTLELGDQLPYLSPARMVAKMTEKELVILTPFYDDHSPLLLSPCYRALVPTPRVKEYRFRSPFSLRKELEGIKDKFGVDLKDRAIIFCVKRKDTLNNWVGRIERIMTEESSERSG